MRIVEHLVSGRRSFSFEFFPTKTPAGSRKLMRTVAELHELSPTFVSVTYGAGGSTRSNTLELVSRIKQEIGIESMAHLTTVGHARHELREILTDLRGAGIENVIALRGDPPKGETQFTPTPDGFAFASDFVRFIRDEGFDFCLAGGAYPEPHPESESRAMDLVRLKEKVDAGTDFLITQLFYDNAFYFDFVTRARLRGITVPIVPGLMPVRDVAQIQRITYGCGATIPARLARRLERVDTPEAAEEVGIEWATEQAIELLER
ncbi:MAG: methylenetetrahydrofolate reductase [NAD(P)H], partial [Dehalococcoidia bacterium]